MNKTIRIILLVITFLIGGIVLFIITAGGGFGKKNPVRVFDMGKPNLIAHRGMLNYFVENSYEGFENCRLHGFGSIETDIRITKDRQLIVFHDDSTNRLLGIDENVENLTCEEIQNHHLLFRGNETGNKVLTLDELLENFKNSFVIYLDNKVNKKWVADSLAKHLKNNEVFKTTIVASSNLLFLSYLKFKNKNINTALEGFDAGKQWIYYLIPTNFKPDYYSSFMSKVDEKQLIFLRKNDLLENKIVYGVDSANVHDVLSSGIHHIIVDFDSSFAGLLK